MRQSWLRHSTKKTKRSSSRNCGDTWCQSFAIVGTGVVYQKPIADLES